MHKEPITVAGMMAASWGVIGFSLLLGFSTWRLSLNLFEALQMPLSWTHWLVFIIFLAFMIYSEGYKGFQKSFSPRFAARFKHLLYNTTPVRLLLAPLFCMSYFHASKRRIIATVVLTIAIVTFLLLFGLIPQPWRGLLDAGVVAGLIWGMATTTLCCIRVFTDDTLHYDAEMPATNNSNV